MNFHAETAAFQYNAAKAARLSIYTPAMLKRIAGQHAQGRAHSAIEADLGIEIRPELAAALS
jgi:hypothetical protein